METTDGSLQLHPTPPGITPAGYVVQLGGRRLTGGDPVRSCRRRLPRAVPEQTLVVVFSPLLGYGLNELVKDLSHSAAVLLVELEPVLSALREHRYNAFPSPLPTNVKFSKTHSNALKTADVLIRSYAIRRTEFLRLTGGARYHRKDYQHLESAIQTMVKRFWHNRGTQIRLGRRWVGNLVRNVQLEARPLATIKTGLKPAVALIGAGSNLDFHHNALRELQSHATLASLDTALPALADAGIVPEIVFSMDGQLANARDLLPWRWDSVSLVADVTVHPSIPRRFPAERRFFFASRFADLPLFDGDLLSGIPDIAPRGSVAPAALDVLVRILGVETVITIGIDFWYRPPRSHARGSSPDRLLRASMDRRTNTDGFSDLLARPVMEEKLRDGTRVRCDAVLHDQAEQMKGLVNALRDTGAKLTIITPDTIGLDTGAVYLPREECLREATRQGASRVRGEGAGGRAGGGTCVPTDHGASNPGRHHQALRQAGLKDLAARLAAQESAPGDHRFFLDAGLDFVLLDMPQWPLLTVRREWMLAHRETILRSVRDYRRRIDRALRSEAV